MANSDNNNCGKCGKIVNLAAKKAIVCDGDCKLAFHKACSGLASKKFEEILQDSDKIWFCVTCKAKREKRRSVMSTPTPGAVASTSTAPASTPQVSTRSSRNANRSDNNTEILEKLNKSLELQEKIQKDIADLKLRLDEYRKIVDELTDENNELRNENEKLNDRMNAFEYKMENDKQQQINNNLVISGIFPQDNENLINIVTDIAATIKSVCKADDVKHVFRAFDAGGASGLPPPIVVEFMQKSVRDDFLVKKKGSGLTTESIQGYIGNARPIYLGESLTRYKQYVFKRARDLKRESVVKYAWVKDGEIFVRVSDNSRIIKIKHPHQIDAFTR